MKDDELYRRIALVLDDWRTAAGEAALMNLHRRVLRLVKEEVRRAKGASAPKQRASRPVSMRGGRVGLTSWKMRESMMLVFSCAVDVRAPKAWRANRDPRGENHDAAHVSS